MELVLNLLIFVFKISRILFLKTFLGGTLENPGLYA